MFCTRCGKELEDRDRFCFECGTATSKGPSPVQRRLMRTSAGKKIAGVCSGIAEYLDADPTMVRVIWLILTFALPPAGIIGYIAAWIVMPRESDVVALAPAPADL
jgi:phage shock protein PspC (stress-responsive transcriptional regulator)